MKLLIIDRDALSNQLLLNRLEERGYDVTVEPVKNDALELLKEQDFEVILFDPAPVQDARAIVINIFKTLKGRYEPQFLLLSKNMTADDALAAGANDLIPKPINPQTLETTFDNLDRLCGYIAQLRHHEELPSRRGIINKDAFNELFLSAVDRSHRYAERSFIVFIAISAPPEACEALAERIRYIRRQSDVIGQTGPQEFGILLQRPLYESEPHDATTRFTEVLSQYVADLETSSMQIDLHLVEIPFGKCHIHTRVTDEDTSVIYYNEDI
jgi:CheY-like chemotaxis protein